MKTQINVQKIKVAIDNLKAKGLFCFYCATPKDNKATCCNSNKFNTYMNLQGKHKKSLIDKEVAQ